jgi:hypothetical protein
VKDFLIMELPKTYEAKNYEADIYQRWQDADAFKPKPAKGEPFSIVSTATECNRHSTPWPHDDDRY